MKRSVFIRSFVVSILLLAPLFSWAAWEVQVKYAANAGAAPQIVKWPNQVVWSWVRNNEQVETLRLRLSLQSSEFSKFNSAKGDVPNTRALLKGDRLLLQLESMQEKIQLTGAGGQAVLVISLQSSGEPLLELGCDKDFFHFRGAEAKQPFYLAAKCDKKNEDYFLVLSFPTEVDVANSTLFETKGKGENYRHYELGNLKASSGTIGRFTLAYQGKNYNFEFHSTKTTVEDKPAFARSLLQVGPAFFSLKVKADTFDGSDSPPGLFVKVPSYKILSKAGVGFQLENSISSYSKSNAMTYSQTEFFADYDFSFGAKLRMSPKAVFVMTKTEDQASRASFEQNQMGVGLVITGAFGERSFVDFEYDNYGLSSTSVKSHSALGLAFRQEKKRGSKFGWGFGYRTQAYLVKSTANLERNFSQNIASIMLIF